MFSTPAVAGDMSLIGSCAGTFYAFDKRNGHTLWSYNIHQDGNQTTLKQVQAVDCPTCGAAPGKKCELSTGHPVYSRIVVDA